MADAKVKDTRPRGAFAELGLRLEDFSLSDENLRQGFLRDDSRYRLLVDSITDYAIYMLDLEGIVVSWNAGAERIKGYVASEIIGHHFSEFYTAPDRDADLPSSALKRAREQSRFEDEGWRVRKDGSEFWAHVVIDPVFDDDGAHIGFAKITRDLTERKLAETSLGRSEEQFRLLVDGVTDYAIYMLDPEGIITSWNAGAERIKGYRSNEIIGDHFSRFYLPEDAAAGVPAKGLEIAARVGRFEKEGWRVRKDGTPFWANVVIDAIRDEDGKLRGFAKVTRDMTERVEAQKALDLARESLFQAQKMEALGQLTGGVAHDFNNLLSVVLGGLELIRKGLPDNPRLMRLLDNAYQAGERASALTQRMLAFARRQELQVEAVELPALINGMNDLLRQAIDAKISVDFRFPLALPAVRTDPSQLETSVLNLVVNARDAMPEGGTITIAARMHIVDEEGPVQKGSYVCLSVADTGTGMDEHTLARAMEPFFTTKGIGRGTGLGLPMVHGLAVQSGGHFTMKSTQGEGTTAELWLPLAIETDARATVEPVAAPMPPTRESLSILAVDDDELVLTNMVSMLEDLGHRVTAVRSAAAALEVLEASHGVDLVITDHKMPQMTGAQLTEVVQQRWPHLAVILASGFAELESIDRARVRLAKPFRQTELSTAIERALQNTGLTDRL